LVLYDLVIKNGILADGTRAKRKRADLCIEGGIIAAVCERFEGEAGQVLDAHGQIVAPGFIDIHTHSDASPLIQDFEPQAKLFQGVTLEITGNCGVSTIPSNDRYRKEINRYYQGTLAIPMGALELREDSVSDVAKRAKLAPPSTHYGMLVGHGTLRGSVMGFGLRDPEPAELEQMEQVLDREMKRGAFGMSLGLIYPPSSFCKVDEIAALAKVVKRHNGIVSVHMRSEGPRIFEAVDEMLEVTRRSGVHLQISHLKLMGRPQWGRAEELLK
jgi:N-acyl-D-amino-acid deacylase